MFLMRSFYRLIQRNQAVEQAGILCRKVYKALRVYHTHGAIYTRDVKYRQVTYMGNSASGLYNTNMQNLPCLIKIPCGIRVESEVEKSWPFKTEHVVENTIIEFQF